MTAINAVWTIPNVLSLMRLLMSVVVFVAIERAAWLPATILFVIAASTDWVDGWWARTFGQASRLGRIFDPLVDKVLVCGVWILLATRDGPAAIAPWMAVVVVVRELVVTAVRAEMERAGSDFSAALSGKLKMVLQCAAVALELAARTRPEWTVAGLDLRTLATWVAWSAVVATIWSGLEYLWAARTLVQGAAGPGGKAV
jgi:CDP-diacylglycerol--glycerol-3-phosphate 3-phosphatidyltransferase